MLSPKQLNEKGEPAMAVVKNGRTTGTTFGWLNGLESHVRYYHLNNNSNVPTLKFKTNETTIVPYAREHGAFSARGDSGSAILDRNGRVVALLTGGGGLTDVTDITFATCWYQLLPLINETLPGAFVL